MPFETGKGKKVDKKKADKKQPKINNPPKHPDQIKKKVENGVTNSNRSPFLGPEVPITAHNAFDIIMDAERSGHGSSSASSEDGDRGRTLATGQYRAPSPSPSRNNGAAKAQNQGGTSQYYQGGYYQGGANPQQPYTNTQQSSSAYPAQSAGHTQQAYPPASSAYPAQQAYPPASSAYPAHPAKPASSAAYLCSKCLWRFDSAQLLAAHKRYLGH